GDMKYVTTRSGIVIDGPFVHMPPSFINMEEDKRVEETLTDPYLAEYTIKVPPPLVQKPKPPSQRNCVRHINITLVDALIIIPKYQNMLKALLSTKEKLLELVNTPLNENCSAVILKKLPEKLGDPGKFLIPYGFSELKCKALANLGAIINLMPLSVWKKLGLPELIFTRMTLELANWVICTPAGIARDVFVPVGKFTFPSDFVIVDYENDPRAPLILGRPFLRTARALIDIHEEEMILHDDPNDNLDDTMPEMFTNEHLYYSPPPLYDEYDDDLDELESDNDDAYNDPFDTKGEKTKESKLLIDKLDLPRSSDFLPSLEYNSFLFEDFSEFDALPSTNNEDKVFNLGILIQENISEVIVQETPYKNVKKIAIFNASLILEDFDPLLYELAFYKEVPGPKTLLLFSS
nr:hypothetical protein [Tanacetum cinerariifolium]